MNRRLDAGPYNYACLGPRKVWRKRLHEASANQLNHAEFLELVLQDELVVRSDRRPSNAGSRPPASVN